MFLFLRHKNNNPLNITIMTSLISKHQVATMLQSAKQAFLNRRYEHYNRNGLTPNEIEHCEVNRLICDPYFEVDVLQFIDNHKGSDPKGRYVISQKFLSYLLYKNFFGLNGLYIVIVGTCKPERLTDYEYMVSLDCIEHN